MRATHAVLTAALALVMSLPSPMASARDEKNEVTTLDAILAQHPLPPGGATAAIVATIRTRSIELGVLVMSRNQLHHHNRQDHVLYLARGTGIARLESARGQIETRPIKPGDILTLPRGKKHGFQKTGDEDLVFLVVAGPGPDAPGDTIIDE